MQVVAFGLVVSACLAASAAALDDANDKAKSTFKSNCVVCHGVDGAGTPVGKSMKAPDLRSDDIQKKKDAELEQSVNDGKGNMPPFSSSLSHEQIQMLIAYVRELGKAKGSPGK
jgi:cytochrome c oxidase cbb3-type subunit 3